MTLVHSSQLHLKWIFSQNFLFMTCSLSSITYTLLCICKIPKKSSVFTYLPLNCSDFLVSLSFRQNIDFFLTFCDRYHFERSHAFDGVILTLKTGYLFVASLEKTN